MWRGPHHTWESLGRMGFQKSFTSRKQRPGRTDNKKTPSRIDLLRQRAVDNFLPHATYREAETFLFRPFLWDLWDTGPGTVPAAATAAGAEESEKSAQGRRKPTTWNACASNSHPSPHTHTHTRCDRSMDAEEIDVRLKPSAQQSVIGRIWKNSETSPADLLGSSEYPTCLGWAF